MDDVDEMRVRGEIDTTVIFIDSSLRDVSAYPDPAEYVVKFQEPLRNVVGVDVLDAQVPSTMYVVDEHNRDMLLYGIGVPSESVSREAYVGDYLRWLLELEGRDAFGLAPDAYDGTYTQQIIARLSVADARLGDPISIPLEDIPGQSNAYDRVMSVTDISTYRASSGPVPPGYKQVRLRSSVYWLPVALGSGVERVIFDEVAGVAVMVTVAIRNADPNGYPILCQRLRFPPGNYSTLTSMISAASSGGGDANAATTTGTPLGDPYMSSQSTDPERLLKVRFDSEVWNTKLKCTKTMIAMDTSCGMSEVLGFISPPKGRLRVQGRSFATNLVDGVLHQYLDGAGVVNMTGERYVIMRCPEIEAGMYASVTSGMQGTGVGLFRLPQPGIIREQRQDYITVIKRPFHPIGKLDQMTLRFERGTSSGALYDFKGVNHMIVLAVKIMVAKRVPATGLSQLNPNYRSNYLDYMIRRWDSSKRRDELTPERMGQAMQRHEALLNHSEWRTQAAAQTETDSDSGPDEPEPFCMHSRM